MNSGSASGGAGFGEARSLGLLDVVRDVVREVAPEELPVVAALGQLSSDEVDRRLARRTSRDDPLGFGMGEIVVVVGPVVWIAVQEVVKRMTTKATDGFISRAGVLVRKWLRRPTPEAPLPRFGPAELDEVHGRVLELAVQAGMDQKSAELLAYRVVDRLRANGSGKGSS